MAKPRLPTVHIHSRPTRSERWPSAIWPGMATRLTEPRAPGAYAGLKPISIRYLVWCTCTAYQEKRPVKKPAAIHQKRDVRTARASVQSTAAHAASTTLAACEAAVWRDAGAP